VTVHTALPAGVQPIDGIVHLRTPHGVAETVDRLTEAITAAGATLFVVVDHSGEASKVGLSLRETKLVVFGNPRGGTPAMEAAPVSALDLPLKVLVWEDDAEGVWMTCLTGQWLADRHGLIDQVAAPLYAPETLIGHVAASA
jgi:uncharacterized protein (DUF302 family)